jgi:hypothetical protein
MLMIQKWFCPPNTTTTCLHMLHKPMIQERFCPPHTTTSTPSHAPQAHVIVEMMTGGTLEMMTAVVPGRCREEDNSREQL